MSEDNYAMHGGTAIKYHAAVCIIILQLSAAIMISCAACNELKCQLKDHTIPQLSVVVAKNLGLSFN